MGRIGSNRFIHDERLLALQVQADRDGTVARLDQLRQEISADVVIWLDHKGRVRHHSADPERQGLSLMSWRLVRRAVFDHKRDTSVVQDLNNLIIYSSGFPDGHAARAFDGIVLVGYVINDQLISNISRDTDVDITLVRRRAVMASTLNRGDNRLRSIPLSYLEYQLLLNDRDKVSEIRFSDTHYFVEARALDSIDPSMEGSIMLTYPQAPFRTIEQNLVNQFFLFSFMGFLLVAFIGSGLSRRVLAPIVRLTERTDQIAAGGDNTHIEIDSRDEVGLLAQRFNNMVDAIEQKNSELRNYSETLEQQVAERTEDLSRANSVLKYKERSLANAQRIARLGSWEWDLVNDRFSGSDELYRIFGITGLPGGRDCLLERLHPDDRPI